MSKHTAAPWIVGGPAPLRPTYTIFNKPFGLGDIAEVYTEADAAHIVRCVNNFDALVEALEAALETDGGVSYGSESEFGFRVCCDVLSYAPHADGCYIVKARAALSAARGES